jgi:hypothetical protein
MGMSPEMMNMMSQMDFSQDKVQAQFSELGLKPEDVIQKVCLTALKPALCLLHSCLVCCLQMCCPPTSTH